MKLVGHFETEFQKNKAEKSFVSLNSNEQANKILRP
jgi:hypothetical protein